MILYQRTSSKTVVSGGKLIGARCGFRSLHNGNHLSLQAWVTSTGDDVIHPWGVMVNPSTYYEGYQ